MIRSSTLAPLALLLAAAAAAAQDPRAREVAELEAMLARVDAALEALDRLARPPVTLVQHDVRHLVHRPADRAAPSLWVPSEAAGFRAARGAGGVLSFCFHGHDEPACLDADRLSELVEAAVGDDAWEEPCSLEVHRGFLLVRQTPVGHARVRRLLDDLARRTTQAVQLDVGFYHLPPQLELAVRKAALEAGGVLDAALLARLDGAVRAGAARLTGMATLSALSEQRVYLHQGDERAYVADYERSSGGTGAVAETVPDPIVEVLRTGLALEVRPTVIEEGEGGPRVALDVRFARSAPLTFVDRATPWGPLTTPRVSMDSVRTSAQVPAGAGVLVFAARGVEDDGTSDVVIVVRPRVVTGR
ncbi:MAG: hypothetical protein M9894_02900 [Planctomycetes bacterium]|nr:hypothetical protein [Planctomycetota bacterium]